MIRAGDNPFAAHRVLALRYRLDAAGWDALLARLAAQRWRGAIVGAEGSGKTTVLEDLATRLAPRGWRPRWVRLSEDAPGITPAMAAHALAGLGSRDLVLLDGAEQLGRGAWWRFRWRTRHAGAVVITTHRPGRLPTLRHCTTSPALLQELVRALGAHVGEQDAIDLWTRHAGNIREALRELYDGAADQAAPPSERNALRSPASSSAASSAAR